MNLVFSDHACEDYLSWQKTGKKVLKRINLLIKDCQRHPCSGLGKPESLKHSLSGYWSRRICGEHRMVYRIEGDNLLIAQLRYHY